jgi:hypothetical protein
VASRSKKRPKKRLQKRQPPKPTRPRRPRQRPGPPFAPEPEPLAVVPETETVQEAVVHIAQDAVLILRRELAHQAELSLLCPGTVKMDDLVALLKLTAELGATAKRGDEAQQADYSRLSPEERAQLAALLLKVDYV